MVTYNDHKEFTGKTASTEWFLYILNRKEDE